jgi:hypothetical protein
MDDEDIALLKELLADLRDVSHLLASIANEGGSTGNLRMLTIHVCDLREKYVREAAHRQGLPSIAPASTKH